MARKKKFVDDKTAHIPRGAEHLTPEQTLKGLPTARLDDQGREILSDEPMVLHLKRRTVTDLETLRHTIQQIRAHDGPIEFETFQEADDFEIEDDYGSFSSRWEVPADGDEPDGPMPSAEEYIRWRQTGELPDRFFKTDPQVAPAPSAATTSGPVQGPTTPLPTEGKPL